MYILKIKSRQILKTFILVKKRINFWDSFNSLIMRSCYHRDDSSIYVERHAFPSRFTYPFCFVASIGCIPSPHNARSHNGPKPRTIKILQFFDEGIVVERVKQRHPPCPLPVAATVTERCISASFGQFQTGRAPAVRFISCDGLKIGWTEILGWFLLSKFAINLFGTLLFKHFWGIAIAISLTDFFWWPCFWGTL